MRSYAYLDAGSVPGMPPIATTPADAAEIPTRRTPRKLLTTAQAAHYVGVTPRTLRRYIAEEKLTAYRLGRSIRIDLLDLEAMIARIDR